MQYISKLTKVQKTILLLFYRFRFLTRTHLQNLLNHKSTSRIAVWINDLYKQGYVLKKEKLDPTDVREPEVFYLSHKSIQVLKKNESCDKRVLRKFYREEKRQRDFIYKCLKTVDIFLIFQSKYQTPYTLNFYTNTDLVEFNYLPSPTCYASIENTGKPTRRYFIEVITPNTYKFVLENLVKKYLEYYEEEIWQSTTHYAFPTILLVVPEERIQNSLQKHLKEKVYDYYGEKEIQFKVLKIGELDALN